MTHCFVCNIKQKSAVKTQNSLLEKLQRFIFPFVVSFFNLSLELETQIVMNWYSMYMQQAFLLVAVHITAQPHLQVQF